MGLVNLAYFKGAERERERELGRWRCILRMVTGGGRESLFQWKREIGGLEQCLNFKTKLNSIYVHDFIVCQLYRWSQCTT